MRSVHFAEINTSALGFGCGSVMGRVGRRASLRAMQVAWDLGVTLFDTARSYGYGEAESLLGSFLEGRRQQATIITKFGILPSRSSRIKYLAKPLVRGALKFAPGARKLVRRNIASTLSPGHFDVATLHSSLHESLRALRTDYIDILLLHEPPTSVFAQDDLMAALQNLIQAGTIRRAGLSATPIVAAQALQQRPAILSALQLPTGGLGVQPPPQLPLTTTSDLLLMANHPFGGSAHAKLLASTIATMHKDPTVPAAFRDKLHTDPRQLAAQAIFSDIAHTIAAHAIIPSMLHLANLRANVAAMDAPSFTRQECQAIFKRL